MIFGRVEASVLETSLSRFASARFTQPNEKESEAGKITTRALQIIGGLGIAPVYRQGRIVMVAQGMDGFTLAEAESEETAEIIVMLWNLARDEGPDKLARRIRRGLGLKKPKEAK